MSIRNISIKNHFNPLYYSQLFSFFIQPDFEAIYQILLIESNVWVIIQNVYLIASVFVTGVLQYQCILLCS